MTAFEDRELEQAIEQLSRRVDYAIDAHDVTLRGECPGCRTPLTSPGRYCPGGGMTGPLYRLGGFCSRHHWPVIGAWLVAVIAIAVIANAVGEKTSDNLSLPGTGSTNAQNLLKDHLPNQAYGTNPVVLQAESGKLTDSKNKQAVDDTVDSLKKQSGVEHAVSPLGKAGKAALSKDKTIGYISVTLNEGPVRPHRRGGPGRSSTPTSPASDAGLKVATGGYLGQAVSKSDTESSEAIGLAAAVVILLFAFGTVTAMMLPIVTAVLGLVASLAIIKLLGHVVDVPSVAPTLATMIGLGVGIDYALFIVTRHKLQLKRRHGDARVDRARHRHGRRRGRLRRRHRRDRAGLAAGLGHPVRRHDGLQRRRRRAGRGDGRDHAAAGAARARSASASTRCAYSSAGPTPTTTSRTAGRAGRAASRRARGARWWRASASCSCCRSRCSTSSSAPRTAASCPRTRPRVRPTT